MLNDLENVKTITTILLNVVQILNHLKIPISIKSTRQGMRFVFGGRHLSDDKLIAGLRRRYPATLFSIADNQIEFYDQIAHELTRSIQIFLESPQRDNRLSQEKVRVGLVVEKWLSRPANGSARTAENSSRKKLIIAISPLLP